MALPHPYRVAAADWQQQSSDSDSDCDDSGVIMGRFHVPSIENAHAVESSGPAPVLVEDDRWGIAGEAAAQYHHQQRALQLRHEEQQPQQVQQPQMQLRQWEQQPDVQMQFQQQQPMLNDHYNLQPEQCQPQQQQWQQQQWQQQEQQQQQQQQQQQEQQQQQQQQEQQQHHQQQQQWQQQQQQHKQQEQRHPEMRDLETFAAHVGKLNKDYMWLVKEGKRMAPYRHYEMTLAAQPGRPILCVLCRASPVSDVLFPCQHMCVCQGCLHEHQIIPGQGCPLCMQPIKQIIPYQGCGLEEQQYWEWCHEIAPPLPRGFRQRFVAPDRLDRAIRAHRKRAMPGAHDSANDDGDEIIVRNSDRAGCCVLS